MTIREIIEMAKEGFRDAGVVPTGEIRCACSIYCEECRQPFRKYGKLCADCEVKRLQNQVNSLTIELSSLYEAMCDETGPITDEEVDRLVKKTVEASNEKKKSFAEFLEEASRTVASWPEWKRNLLRDSSKAQWDTPRKPVSNA